MKYLKGMCCHHHCLKSIFSHSVGLDSSFPWFPCFPVGWVNVGNIRRSSVFCDCFSPCFAGSPTWFPPSNWKIKKFSGASGSLQSLLATCPYHLSLLFLITCLILTRPTDWRRSSFFFLSHSERKTLSYPMKHKLHNKNIYFLEEMCTYEIIEIHYAIHSQYIYFVFSLSLFKCHDIRCCSRRWNHQQSCSRT